MTRQDGSRPNEGRPLKFKTAQEIQDAANSYFENTVREEWTITGLAMALDTTRKTLIDYDNKDEFSYTIKKLKTQVENAYEISLRRHGRSGDIFGLKNFGWKDKTEQDLHVKELPKPIMDISNGVFEDDSNQED